MSDNTYISWTSFCQVMNSIDYWLLQNQKKYKKHGHYQILTLKCSCKDIEKKAKKLGNDKLVSMYTMALIKDNKSLDFLPNYVTLKNGEQIDKSEYVDMAIRTEAYIRANGRLSCNCLYDVQTFWLQWFHNESVYQNIQLQKKHNW